MLRRSCSPQTRRAYFRPSWPSIHRRLGVLDFSMTEFAEMEAELARLKQEHRDLDMAIDALESMVAGDQLQVQRLKKRKLALKDQIIRLEEIGRASCRERV